MDEVLLSEETARTRTLKGPLARINRGLLILTPVLGVIFLLDLPQRMGWLVFGEQYMGLFLAITLCATFLTVPEGAWGHADSVPWYDLLAALGGLVIGLYIFVNYPGMVNSLGEIHTVRVILGCLTIVLLAEACRRLTGWSLVIIAAIFLFYAFFAYLFPGPFYGRGWSVQRVATYLYLDRNGIFGQSLEVAAGIVLVFILFGIRFMPLVARPS